MFPEEQGTKISVECRKPVKFTLQIRYPYWAKNGIDIRINGRSHKVKQQPGSFIAIKRTWKQGDAVEVKMPFSLRLETMPDDSDRVAVLYGPVVMSGILGPEEDSLVTDPLYVPVLITAERDPAKWLKPVEGKTNEFITNGVGKPRDVELKPFYATHNLHYTVYWDLFDQEDWNKRETSYRDYQEHIKRLKEMTVDFAQPGEMQAERDHNFKSENSTPGFFKERANRESRGGWFSFEMKVLPDKPAALVVDYWGGFPGAKTFDILIDGKVIATENMTDKKEGQFFDIQYNIPEGYTRGKRRISVMFRAHDRNTAGPVFGVRVINAEKPAGEV
jgi:hypothetical protein